MQSWQQYLVTVSGTTYQNDLGAYQYSQGFIPELQDAAMEMTRNRAVNPAPQVPEDYGDWYKLYQDVMKEDDPHKPGKKYDAAFGSRAIRNVLASQDGLIVVWRSDNTGEVRRIDIPIAQPRSYAASGWTVMLDSTVQETVTNYRHDRLPNETGGVLLGTFDMSRKVALVSTALPSPGDSREWPTVYIRGSAGLQSAVSRAEITTGGGLEYLGEWHSHPKGASAAASKDDRKALTLLSAVMAEDARPAIMLIVGEDEIRLYVRDHLGPVGSAA